MNSLQINGKGQVTDEGQGSDLINAHRPSEVVRGEAAQGKWTWVFKKLVGKEEVEKVEEEEGEGPTESHATVIKVGNTALSTPHGTCTTAQVDAFGGS